MFSATKNRMKREAPACPCNNVCRCHQPSQSVMEEFFILGLLILLLGAIPIIAIFPYHLAPQVRYIQVNGKQCTINHVADRCASTGACSGHDEAVCQ